MKTQTKSSKGFKTILIVDDEADVRDIVSEMITDLGYEVRGADSGEAALDLMATTPFDLVISDVKMRGMDGLALLRRLRRRFPKLPLAIMTAHPNIDVQRLVQDNLVDFLLLKPFQMDELRSMVQNLTRQYVH